MVEVVPHLGQGRVAGQTLRLQSGAQPEPVDQRCDGQSHRLAFIECSKRSNLGRLGGIKLLAAKRLAFKPFGMAFAKFWGYPMRLASSLAEAMEIAGNLLSERAGSAL